jgi:hypothetical protein
MFAQYLDAYADEDEPSDDLHLLSKRWPTRVPMTVPA